MRNHYIPFSCIVCALFLMQTLVGMAHAESADIDEAVCAIGKRLPSGWSIVEQKSGEIPKGHHWCDKYDGVTGTKIVIRGIKPSRSHFLGRNDQWKAVEVGAESLNIWIMPGDYRDSRLAWFCFHRPIQPTKVFSNHKIRIYARPGHHSTVDEKKIFDIELERSKAVSSPESPWNDPTRISWQTWQSDLNAVMVNTFGD